MRWRKCGRGDALAEFDQVGVKVLTRKSVRRPQVNSIFVVDENAEQLTVSRGQLIPDTAFVFETRAGSGLKITGQRRCGGAGVVGAGEAADTGR